MILAAMLISLSIVGIDITVLGVFGGALGVGLGFGLQKIASNYVSGFIILLDRSLRLGDTINVAGFQGHGHADPHALHRRARARRHRNADSERKAHHRRGAEPLVVPDARQREGRRAGEPIAPTSIARCTLLVEATHGVERVLHDPAPAALPRRVSARTASISNWASGSRMPRRAPAASRSQVNRNIWRLFASTALKFRSRNAIYRIVDGLPTRSRRRRDRADSAIACVGDRRSNYAGSAAIARIASARIIRPTLRHTPEIEWRQMRS